MRPRHTPLFATLLAALAGCGSGGDGDSTTPGFSRAAIEADIRTLSADRFGGRAPMTPGGRMTVEYLERRFAETGAEPLFGDSYTQPVPLIAITPAADTTLRVNGNGHAAEYRFGEQVMLWTDRRVESVELANSELVFAGYGIVAPEYNWNDYAGIDVDGKTVIVLVNDPGFATGDEDLFKGRAMTYYGRWTYKLEEAARQGAAAALIVHQTEPASYPWQVVESSWSGPQYHLDAATDEPTLQVSGWLTHDTAAGIMQRAGRSIGALQRGAAQRSFQAVALGLSASTVLHNHLEHGRSANVGARIPGGQAPQETIAYLAHWDHLGTAADAGAGEDAIYNGAVDNATGLAGLLALAEAFVAAPSPRRTVALVAVTAEESGLLGSEFYAEQPPVPLAHHVGVINIDSMNVFGPTHDVVVIGHGQSEMEEWLQRAAAHQDRIVVPEHNPEAGGFYRSDHFSLAKRGVPALYAKSGNDHIEHGPEWMRQARQQFTAERYHKPGDEFSAAWDLRGLLLDLALYYRLGEALARSEAWPQWYPGSEFRAARQQDRAAERE